MNFKNLSFLFQIYLLSVYFEGVVLVTKSCPTLAIPWTAAHQAPLSVGFSRQKYWSGLPWFPSPGDHPNPGIKLGSATLQAVSLPSEPPGKLKVKVTQSCLILCDPMDYTVHVILQARILE